MREILFRGFSSSEVFYGHLFTEMLPSGALYAAIVKKIDGHYRNVVVDEKTVGQFTGLTDCNGVKIFENDIIIQHAEWNETSYFGNGESECDSFEVEFIGVVSITASKGVVINSVKKMDMIIGGGWVRHPHSINVRGARSRVIGNIHQNPELLERTHA